MDFRFLETGFNTPAMNMAIDEALLSSPLPVLRFYRWKPPGLSLGNAQAVKGVIDVEFCASEGIGIVRRITGGNAVLHDRELTYSFIVDESLVPASIQESYKYISSGILRALSLLGLDATMNNAVENGEKSAVCFQEPSWYEILVNGKKLVGSAQKRTQGKVLQHGAVLLDSDITRYSHCFLSHSEKMVASLSERMTSIHNELRKAVSYEELSRAMQWGFEEALGITLKKDELTSEELRRAEKLAAEKYSQDAWNLQKV